MKSDVVRFERGQIWIYEDHKDKKDKKICAHEKGLLIGKRPVLLLSVKDNKGTVIKGSRKHKYEKYQIEYNDGTGIGVFDTLQMETIDLSKADLKYSAKIENSILKEVNNMINVWLFDYVDEYNNKGLSRYLKKQVWDYIDNGVHCTGIIVKRFKKSAIIIPLINRQNMLNDIKIDSFTDILYTDISSIHTISTDQLRSYQYTISEEIYSSVLNSANEYLHGNIPIKQEKPKFEKNTKAKTNHKKHHKKHPKKKFICHESLELPTEHDVPKKISKLKKDKPVAVACPMVFKHLSYDELVKEFNEHTPEELRKKYSVSQSTIRRGRTYIKESVK